MQVLVDTTAMVTTAAAPVAATDMSFTDRLAASFTNAMTMLFTAIPRIIGFIIVVLIGWFVASLLARGVTTLLRAARFNDIAARTGVSAFAQRGGVTSDSSAMVGSIVKWLVRIVVLLVAFDLLGLPAVSDVLRQFLLWLPNLIVAVVILLIAGVAANGLANVVRGATSESGFSNPETLAHVTRIAVWAFAVVIAVNQLGIASTVINSLVSGLVAAVALAVGLAFGLGGRDMAARKLESWDKRGRGGSGAGGGGGAPPRFP